MWCVIAAGSVGFALIVVDILLGARRFNGAWQNELGCASLAPRPCGFDSLLWLRRDVVVVSWYISKRYIGRGVYAGYIPSSAVRIKHAGLGAGTVAGVLSCRSHHILGLSILQRFHFIREWFAVGVFGIDGGRRVRIRRGFPVGSAFKIVIMSSLDG